MDNLFEEFKNAARGILKVSVDAKHITIHYHQERTESYFFEELKEVTLITTDEGPFEEDVFWLMLFENGIILIPQGCAGAADLLPILQGFPDFDNQQVIKAMSCSENQTFLVWRREGSSLSELES